jgi:hypothetical protein
MTMPLPPVFSVIAANLNPIVNPFKKTIKGSRNLNKGSGFIDSTANEK